MRTSRSSQSSLARLASSPSDEVSEEGYSFESLQQTVWGFFTVLRRLAFFAEEENRERQYREDGVGSPRRDRRGNDARAPE